MMGHRQHDTLMLLVHRCELPLQIELVGLVEVPCPLEVTSLN